MRKIVEQDIPNTVFDDATLVKNLKLEGLLGYVIEVEDAPEGESGLLIFVPGIYLFDLADQTDEAGA